jgi:hypothetical protein
VSCQYEVEIFVKLFHALTLIQCIALGWSNWEKVVGFNS